MKIIEKKLPIGKWRTTVAHEIAGHEVTGVAIKGLRDRPWPLRQATEAEFFERHPKDEHGKPSDTAVVLRGTPNMWLQQGTLVYLWPAPSQDWILQITLEPRGNHGQALSEGLNLPGAG